ncbi:MAG: oligosaccharide flippase family protein [Actinomycetes bacterium]
MTAPETPMPSAGRGRGPLKPMIAKLRGSDTGYAAILAGAMIATNLVALITTVAFGRLLHVEGYGQLAAILSTFIILSVPGAALQVATAREGALGHLGEGREFATTLRRWTITLIFVTIAVTVVSIIVRVPIATVIGVKQEWAAAFVPPAACIWILLSIQRGALQATRAYPAVGWSMIGEQIARLVLGVGLALTGLDVTGAYLGTPLAMVATSVILGLVLSRRLGGHSKKHSAHGLRRLTRNAWAAIIGLALIAVLQNVDVIVAQHRLHGTDAGAYAAAAVAAKVVVWVAIGIGFYLLPEAARRHAEGQDARPVLRKALAMTAAVAAPCLIVYLVAPELLLKLAFGGKYSQGSEALFELGIAMAFLSVCYLAVQLLLALREVKFLWFLALVAAAEPAALLMLPNGGTVNGYARTVLYVQVVAATGALIAAYRASAAPRIAKAQL